MKPQLSHPSGRLSVHPLTQQMFKLAEGKHGAKHTKDAASRQKPLPFWRVRVPRRTMRRGGREGNGGAATDAGPWSESQGSLSPTTEQGTCSGFSAGRGRPAPIAHFPTFPHPRKSLGRSRHPAPAGVRAGHTPPPRVFSRSPSCQLSFLGISLIY